MIRGVTWHRVEIVALCGVVLTLPFHLFTWGVGGQSVSPTEAAILLAAGLVAGRRVTRRTDLTPPPPLIHEPFASLKGRLGPSATRSPRVGAERGDGGSVLRIPPADKKTK